MRSSSQPTVFTVLSVCVLFSACGAEPRPHDTTPASDTIGNHTAVTEDFVEADGGVVPCPGNITVNLHGTLALELKSICKGGWDSSDTKGAEGYIEQGGVAGSPEHTDIDGCSSKTADAQSLEVSLVNALKKGSYTNGTITYTDGSTTWSNDTSNMLNVAITKFGSEGGRIAGTYSGTVTNGHGAAQSIEGEFDVCRVRDLDAP